MTIRTLSPFPIEHVYWGWYKDQHYPWILVYAATKDALNRAGYEEIEPFQQVFPSFLSTVPLTFEDPTLYYFYHPHTQTLTLNIHPGKQVIPESSDEDSEGENADEEDSEEIALPEIHIPIIHSVQVIAAEPDFDDERVEEEELEEGEVRMPTFEDISDAREHLQAQLPDPDQYHSEDTWLEHLVAATTKDRSILFHHEWGSSSEPQPGPETQISSTQAWQADVRSLEFKNEARQVRKRERQLLLAAQIAGIVAVLLIFLELASVVGGKWSQGMSDNAAAAQPQVDVIMGKRELLFKIEQVSTNNLVPFKMLQGLNNHRSGGIYFEEVEASQGNRMFIEGQAANSGEMNAYKKALIDSGVVLTCDLEMITKKGILYFEMDMTFPPYQSPPIPSPSKSLPAPKIPKVPNAPVTPAPPTPITPPGAPNSNNPTNLPNVPPFPIPTNNTNPKPTNPPKSSPPSPPTSQKPPTSPSQTKPPSKPPATTPKSTPVVPPFPTPPVPSNIKSPKESGSSSTSQPKSKPSQSSVVAPKKNSTSQPKATPVVPPFPTPTTPPKAKPPTSPKSSEPKKTEEEQPVAKPPARAPSGRPKTAPPALPPGFPPPPPLPSNK